MSSEHQKVDKAQQTSIEKQELETTGEHYSPSLTSLQPHFPQRADNIRGLQRVIGNRAVMRTLNVKRPHKPTLEVADSDEFEPLEDTSLDEMYFSGASAGMGDGAPNDPKNQASIRRSFSSSVVQREGEEEKVEIIPPFAGSASGMLSAMMTFVKQKAEKSNTPEIIGGTAYFVIADKFYVYDSGGQILDTYALQFADKGATLPHAGYYLDDGTAAGWKTFVRIGQDKVGFRLLVFENVKSMQFSQWLSPEALQKLTAHRGNAKAILMAISSGGKGGEGQTPSGPPSWAKDQSKRIQDKLAKLKGQGGGTGGQGSGSGTGTGKGSGNGTGTDKTGGQGTGEKKGSGEGKTYNPVPDKTVLWADKSSKPFVNVWVEGAHVTLELKEGETDEELLKRIQDGTIKMRMDADPELSTKLAKGVSETKISDELKPGEIPPALDEANAKVKVGSGATPADPELRGLPNNLKANTPAYPAQLINYGQDITVTGGTNRFTMELDFSSAGRDTLSQVAARMQPIRYTWELINVSALNPKDYESGAKQIKMGDGENHSALSGMGNDLARAYANIEEDTRADLKDLTKNPELAIIDWPARMAWLQVIGISNVVQMGGALVSSYISLMTSPLNERSIGFDNEGDYILRCIATPMVNDEQAAEPDKHLIRASSIAVAPVKVMNVNKRAEAAVQEPPKEIADAKKELEALPKDSKERDALMKRITMLEGENTPQQIERQIKELGDKLQVVKDLEKAIADKTPLEDKQKVRSEVRSLNFLLTAFNIPRDEYRRNIEKGLEQLQATKKGIDLLSVNVTGDTVRPRVVLASEENGQVIDMQMMLGKSAKTKGKQISYTLIDVTSPKTRDHYEGSSSSTGEDGHREAIMAAFNNFRANNGYGRGTIRITAKMPVALDDGKTTTLEFNETLRSAPGEWKRTKQRLQDLATAAEIAGLFLSGPAGLAVGAIGGLAGGIVAADNIASKLHGDRFEWNYETGMDIVGIVGGAMSLAQPAALALRASKTWGRAARVAGGGMHILGTGMMLGQVVQIPYSVLREFEAIEKEAQEQNLPPGEVAARRAAAIMGAVRAGLITVITFKNGLEEGGGAPSKKDPLPNTPEHAAGTAPKGESVPTPHGDGAGSPPKDVPNPVSSPKPRPKMEPTLLAPKNINDVKSANLVKEATHALGVDTIPQSGRIRLVDESLVNTLYERASGKKPPDDMIGFRDTDANILYIPRSKMTPELQTQLQTLITKRISPTAKKTFGDNVVKAFVDNAIANMIYDSQAQAKVGNAADMLLVKQLEAIVGAETLGNAMFGAEVPGVRAKLIEKFGQARANAIEAMMRGGRSGEALGMMGEPNVALRNKFGETLSAGVEDLVASEAGGTPRNAQRHAMIKELAALVGADVLKNALLHGDVDGLQTALEGSIGKARAQDLTKALLEGNIANARQALKEAPAAKAAASAKPTAATASGAKPGDTPAGKPGEGQPTTDTTTGAKPATSVDTPAPKAKKPLSEKAAKAVEHLAKLITDNPGGNHHDQAMEVIEHVGSFKRLREMIEDGTFGDSPEAKAEAKRLLQDIRKGIVDEILKQVQAKMQAKYPGLKLNLKDLGTPGFGSDRDVTLRGEGELPPNEKVQASLEAVGEAYKALNDAGFPPDAALDSNFYTELHEGSIKAKDAKEAHAIGFDESVVSMTEMRMNMNEAQWKAYKADQMKKIGGSKPAKGLEGALTADAQQRLEQQMSAAEKMYDQLGGGKIENREAMLGKAREELLAALKQTPPASARKIRDLMARVKLLEPDAYGTRAAVEGVVDTQQGLARSKFRNKDLEQQGAERGERNVDDQEERLKTVDEILNERAGNMQGKTKAEKLATLAQEASASLAKMFGHAPGPGMNKASDVRALAKYLARIHHAFREAGMDMANSLIDRGGNVVGTKQEADTLGGTMRELRAWAQDTNQSHLTDQQLMDAFVEQAQKVGQDLTGRLRAAELMAHSFDNPGMIAPDTP